MAQMNAARFMGSSGGNSGGAAATAMEQSTEEENPVPGASNVRTGRGSKK